MTTRTKLANYRAQALLARAALVVLPFISFITR
jgi:hypothetical protein